MESSSEANKINISGAAYEELIKEKTKLTLTSRGIIEVKGKGKMETFWVTDRTTSTKIAGMSEVCRYWCWRSGACKAIHFRPSHCPSALLFQFRRN